MFRLGTFARRGGAPFAGLVLDATVFDLAAAHRAWAASARSPGHRIADPGTMAGLLADWDRNFAVLQELAAFAGKEGAQRFGGGAFDLAALDALAPVPRPSKMLYAAANYADHVAEMRASGFAGGDFDKSRDFMGDKAKTRPYSFLKAPSCLVGAHADIVLPKDHTQIDWEAEMALAIGRPAKRVPAERALEHVAGFMTTNDVSCRDAQWRPDRATLRSDWVGGKSYDSFAPMGPFLVPRAFVQDHMNLRIMLAVNGETMQDGNTGGLIFTPEEQIEYYSRAMTLEPGDIFATGTPGGVGQGRGQFLKAGDVVETEVEGLGRQRNRVIAET